MASTARLIRETLEQFTGAQVFTTGDPLRAFELALQRHYGLFFFAMQVGELSGPLLYELIAKAWSAADRDNSLRPSSSLGKRTRRSSPKDWSATCGSAPS